MRVVVDDVSLFFDVEGCGLVADGATMTPRPTLVLLHGGPGADHSLFKPEFTAIADAAQVVYLDQRGSGRSDRGVPEQWTWTRWADDVAAFCAALGICRPILLGTSSGGLVAMACAARHPDLVAGLVLDSPLGSPTNVEESLDVFERRGGPVAREAARRYLGGDTSEAAARAWSAHALPLYQGSDTGDMAVRRERALINDEVQAHFRAGGCGPVDAKEYAASIASPVLILARADDPVSPAAAAPRLGSWFANASVHILPRVGHGVFRQAPHEAFALLRTFVAERVPSPHPG